MNFKTQTGLIVSLRGDYCPVLYEVTDRKNEDKVKRCAHCLNTISDENFIILDFEHSKGERLVFCCTGCRAVFQAINKCDLGDYYKIRDQQMSVPVEFDSFSGGFDYLDTNEIKLKFTEKNNPFQMKFYVSGIHCAACVWILEKIPELNSSILSVRIDGLQKIALVEISVKGKFSYFAKYAKQFGYIVHPLEPENNDESKASEDRRTELKRIAITAVSAGNIMLLAASVYLGAEPNFLHFFNWLSLALMLPVLLIGAKPIFLQSISSVKARVPSLDLPLAIAILAGFLLSFTNLLQGKEKIYFDSLSVLIFLILVSRFFVARLQEKFTNAARGVQALFPITAKLLQNGKIFIVPAETLKENQIVRIQNGEKIPCDGEIIRGGAWINEAILTGEAISRFLTKGNQVFAGTILESGSIEIRVSQNTKNSRMGKLLTNAISSALLKGRVTKKLERWAQNFTWIVLFTSLNVFFYFLYSIGFSVALDRTFSLLIVACPCAIAFGAPLVYSQALLQATKQGIFFRSADIFERIQKIQTIVFDKTGTLTIAQLELVSSSAVLPREVGLAIAAIENKTVHPVARAIVKHFSDKNQALPEVEFFKVLPGKGIMGRVNGIDYKISSSIYSNQKNSHNNENYIIWVDIEWNGSLVTLGFMDKVRQDTKILIQKMEQKRLSTAILSGDKKENVLAVGSFLGIDKEKIFFEKSPEEKEKIIRQMNQPAMVGDGINDVAAMASSKLSIVVGGAVENALRVADIFFTNDNILSVLVPWQLSDRVCASLFTIRIFSIFYNFITAGLAIFGFITPLVAAVLMPISSILVLLISIYGMKGSLWK